MSESHKSQKDVFFEKKIAWGQITPPAPPPSLSPTELIYHCYTIVLIAQHALLTKIYKYILDSVAQYIKGARKSHKKLRDTKASDLINLLVLLKRKKNKIKIFLNFLKFYKVKM